MNRKRHNDFLKIKLSRAGLLFFYGLILFIFCPCFKTAAQPVAENEYRLKAAFIYNFAKYVTWPDSPRNGERFIIGILGENPFERELNIIQGKMVNGSTIEIRQYDSIEEVRGCRILFIASSERKNIAAITNILKRYGILTVSDTTGYAHMGVMINLYVAENRLRFEINKGAAESAGLKISSHLLRLGKIIEPENRDFENEKIQ